MCPKCNAASVQKTFNAEAATIVSPIAGIALLAAWMLAVPTAGASGVIALLAGSIGGACGGGKVLGHSFCCACGNEW